MRVLTILLYVSLGGLLSAASHFYDDADRLVRSVHADGTTTLYTYDAANNLLEVAVANGPPAPRLLGATLDATTTATVTWEDNAASETGYRVERRLATGYVWRTRAELPADSTSFVDTGLNANATYVYRVLAIGSGELTSAYSVEAVAAAPLSETFSIRSFSTFSDRLELAFDGEVGATYRLETNTDLGSEGWSTLPFALSPGGAAATSSVAGTGNPMVLYIDQPADSPRFYRLVRE